MKKLLLIAAGVAGLVTACGGVDRDGTRDEIIESIESAGGTADADCIDAVFDKYSDDQLESIDEQLGESSTSMPAEATQLFTELGECFTFES